MGARPAYKGIIRARRPEMCPLGALFRWLSIRFTVKGEKMPLPGTSEWDSFYIWPGRSTGGV